MVHIEFAILLLALLWLMWMVAAYRDSGLGHLQREVDDIKANEAYTREVLRIALTEIIGIAKTEAVVEAADRYRARYRESLASDRFANY